MLVGEPPYPGSTAQAVLGKIIQGVPVSATAVRQSIPLNVDAAIRRALEKIPADRFTDAQGFAKALADPGFRHGEGESGTSPATSIRALVGTAVAAALVGLALGWGIAPQGAESGEVIRQRLEPLGSGVTRPVGSYTALAPDGSSVVYASEDEDGQQWRLWLKALGSSDAEPLSGTEYGKNPVYSPDSEWIAFHSQGSVKKRHLRDGTTLALAEGVAAGEVGIAWLDDGTIVYEPEGPPTLVRIPDAGGGPPDTIATWDMANLSFAGALPGARGVLVGLCTSSCLNMTLHVVDLESGTSKPLVTEAMRGWFASTGHLIYVRNDGALFAAPFDLDKLELTGSGTPLTDGVATVASSPQIVIGADGTVLYLEGETPAAQNEVLWVNRSGSAEPVSPDLVGPITNVALSSDERRIAATILDQSIGAQLWVKELPEGAFTRLTTDDGLTRRPIWSRDDQTIAYITNPAGPYEARTVRSDGSTVGGFETLMAPEGSSIMEVFYTPDEAGLLFRTGDANTGGADLGFLDLATGTVNDSVLASSFNERGVSLSPDGRWMAYTSNASGRNEVFVRPFPEARSRVAVSTAGGTDPVWAKNGNQLFFVGGDGWLTAATYRTEPGFGVETITRLVDATSFYSYSTDWRRFDVTSDGQRFLMVRRIGAAETTTRGPILIQNFFEEVKARVSN
jgi:Tol biopolymer transport system component